MCPESCYETGQTPCPEQELCPSSCPRPVFLPPKSYQNPDPTGQKVPAGVAAILVAGDIFMLPLSTGAHALSYFLGER